MRSRIFSITGLFLILVILTGCASAFNSNLNHIVKPYRFSTINWEIDAISNIIKQSFTGPAVSVDDSQTVLDYFAAIQQNELPSQELTHRTENIIELQIRTVLSEEDIHNPLQTYIGFLSFSFPPLDFTLSKPPHILIISPLDKIETIDSIMLQQDMTVEQMDEIENETEKLNVSSLVVEIGGLGATFPTFVNYKTSLKYAINAATEEWLHQFLAFTPLGWRYVLHLLGIRKDYDIVTVNETVASMIADEIGGKVYDKYYAAYDTGGQSGQAQQENPPSFDFNAAMRQIRLTVDALLAGGQVQEAEQYMDEQRDYLQTKGYYIRKLNQAYFAFYGSYAESPTSVNPIGKEIEGIRNQSASLSQFLDNVAKVTSVSGLEQLK